MGSITEQDDLIFHDLPPFPTDVPTAPLLRLNLARLLSNDPTELDQLWTACRNVGFFYLDLRDAPAPPQPSSTARPDSPISSTSTPLEPVTGNTLLSTTDHLFPLATDLFSLPLETKLQYDFKSQNSYFGYKGLGAGVIDKHGTRDANEFYNVSKDDVLGLAPPLPAPPLLAAPKHRAVLATYIHGCHALVTHLLGLLGARLGLPAGTLEGLHRLDRASGDQVRFVRAPFLGDADGAAGRRAKLGEHTDFGSVTVLFNRLSGLQVLMPGRAEWCYVKPLRGHCVVNLGDALVKFTRGVLRSNIHRVVAPAGEQRRETRLSLVYFSRPEDEVLLKPLEGSAMIDGRKGDAEQEEVMTAKDWILKRAMGRRTGGDFAGSAGTEGDRIKG